MQVQVALLSITRHVVEVLSAANFSLQQERTSELKMLMG
jgi:hypothetical protein